MMCQIITQNTSCNYIFKVLIILVGSFGRIENLFFALGTRRLIYKAVLCIRIQIGSGFSNFMNPDPYAEFFYRYFKFHF